MIRDSRFYNYWFVYRRHNWWELMKFCAVGASGVVVNIAVFWSLHELAGMHYLGAAVPAFLVANLSNYLLNRYWTFPRTVKRVTNEYAQFLFIGVLALVLNELLLILFVEHVGWPEVGSQLVSVMLVTPVGFVGNKLLTFKGKL